MFRWVEKPFGPNSIALSDFDLKNIGILKSWKAADHDQSSVVDANLAARGSIELLSFHNKTNSIRHKVWRLTDLSSIIHTTLH